MELRDVELEKSSLVVALVAKRPKSEKLLLLVGAKPLNAEDITLFSPNACKLLVSGLVICCRPSGTRDEKISWSDCVRTANLAWSPGGILRTLGDLETRKS